MGTYKASKKSPLLASPFFASIAVATMQHPMRQEELELQPVSESGQANEKIQPAPEYVLESSTTPAPGHISISKAVTAGIAANVDDFWVSDKRRKEA